MNIWILSNARNKLSSVFFNQLGLLFFETSADKKQTLSEQWTLKESGRGKEGKGGEKQTSFVVSDNFIFCVKCLKEVLAYHGPWQSVTEVFIWSPVVGAVCTVKRFSLEQEYTHDLRLSIF